MFNSIDFSNAFKQLNEFDDLDKSLNESLNEQDFNLTRDMSDRDEIDSFLNDAEEDKKIPVFDLDAEDESKLDDSNVGKIILECPCCATLICKNADEVEIPEGKDAESLVNIGTECPVCFSEQGYKIIGKVAPYEETTIEIEPKDDETDATEAEPAEDKTEEATELLASCNVENPDDSVITMIADALGKVSADTITKIINIKDFTSAEDEAEELPMAESLNEGIIGTGAAAAGAGLGGAIGGAIGGVPGAIAGGLIGGGAGAVAGGTVDRRFDLAQDLVSENCEESCSESKAEDMVNSFANLFGRGTTYKVGNKKFTSEEEANNFAKKNKATVIAVGTADQNATEKARAKTIGRASKRITGMNDLKTVQDATDIINAANKVRPDTERTIADYRDPNEIVGMHGEVAPGKSNGEIKGMFENAENAKEMNAIIADSSRDTTAQVESLKEGLNDVQLDTDHEHISIHSEPKADNGEEMIAPLDFQAANEIADAQPNDEFEDNLENVEPAEEPTDEMSEMPAEGEAPMDMGAGEEAPPMEDEYNPNEEEVPVDEFDDQQFNQIGESFLKKVYENVSSYTTSSIKESGDKLICEGVITFDSGKSGKTQFILEGNTIKANGKCQMLVENAQITPGKQDMILEGTLQKGKFIPESLSYNYKVGKSKVSGKVTI